MIFWICGPSVPLSRYSSLSLFLSLLLCVTQFSIRSSLGRSDLWDSIEKKRGYRGRRKKWRENDSRIFCGRLLSPSSFFMCVFRLFSLHFISRTATAPIATGSAKKVIVRVDRERPSWPQMPASNEPRLSLKRKDRIFT